MSSTSRSESSSANPASPRSATTWSSCPAASTNATRRPPREPRPPHHPRRTGRGREIHARPAGGRSTRCCGHPGACDHRAIKWARWSAGAPWHGVFHGYALACLVTADRYYHLDTEIHPALDAGKVVICDRYIPSSYALQVLDGVTLDFIAAINTHARWPDLSVILTGDPAELQRRLAVRGSHGRFEDNPYISRAEVERYDDIATMLTREGTRIMVLDSTRNDADFLAAHLASVIQALRSQPHH